MRKSKLKGFTLIECIVAMAIIGVASLLIAQVYGSVALINKRNAALNTSLVEQMKIAERESKTGTTAVQVVKNDDKISITKKTGDTYNSSYSNSSAASKFDIHTDNAQVEVYILKPGDSVDEDTKTYSMDSDVRYKFILPKTATVP